MQGRTENATYYCFKNYCSRLVPVPIDGEPCPEVLGLLPRDHGEEFGADLEEGEVADLIYKGRKNVIC